MNKAVNCRKGGVGLLEEAAGCTLGPASAMELVLCRSKRFAVLCVAGVLGPHLPGGVGAGL